MKILAIITLVGLALFGCSLTYDEPGIEGYVVNADNGRILVVSSVPEDFSSTGGLDEFYNAISFSNAPEDIQVGQKVQVWFDEVAESYPGQSGAKKVFVLQAEQPEQANLTEPEVIRQALDAKQQNSEMIGVPVIKAVNYHESTDVWTVEVKRGEEVLNVEVKDSKKEG